MAFDPKLNYGDELSNDNLRNIFKCSPQGGMRKSNKTNTLLLISDNTQNYYNDRWDGDIFYYTGMGLEGDQSITFMQNKTLAESNINGVDVFLFEVNSPRVYTFIGKVKLVGKPFKENQPDKNNNLRSVWVFPLKLVNQIITLDQFIKKQQLEEKKIKKLSLSEILKKAKKANKVPGKKEVIAKVYERDPSISAYVKFKANGICQLCGSPAPFKTLSNEPYLEVHHVIWLSQNGEDSINNTTALCPNCHKKMHILNLEEDKNHLLKKIYSANN